MYCLMTNLKSGTFLRIYISPRTSKLWDTHIVSDLVGKPIVRCFLVEFRSLKCSKLSRSESLVPQTKDILKTSNFHVFKGPYYGTSSRQIVSDPVRKPVVRCFLVVLYPLKCSKWSRSECLDPQRHPKNVSSCPQWSVIWDV
jgi:hypothetical protein